ncbi:hypothetical protein HRI_005101900 [Hibiscus trionum]|uniref:Uncharacterized protein n=1 Tax=Hibiscus trionum TaxID=183268 RepID=A0A9W7JJI1_HIBTR|nr:hypothetical protein HRI_005101900 [Hibiscus trionum]
MSDLTALYISKPSIFSKNKSRSSNYYITNFHFITRIKFIVIPTICVFLHISSLPPQKESNKKGVGNAERCLCSPRGLYPNSIRMNPDQNYRYSFSMGLDTLDGVGYSTNTAVLLCVQVLNRAENKSP